MDAVTVTGGREWIATLEGAAKQAPDQVRKVVSKGSLNIKQDWRRRWSGHAHIPRLPYAIGYDITTGPVAVSSEIGVDQSKPQGPLAGIIAWGSPAGNAPLPGPLEALDAEGPRFESALATLAAKLLEQ